MMKQTDSALFCSVVVVDGMKESEVGACRVSAVVSLLFLLLLLLLL